jgi:hypothetical protein
MTKSYISKLIRQFERRYLPKLRHNKRYRKITSIVLIPVALLTHILDTIISFFIGLKPKKPTMKLNFRNIVDGFSNLAFPSEEVEKLAKSRAEICAACPFAVKTGVYSVVVDNRTKQIQGMKCDRCGCNLSAKVRSVNDTCPLGKW